MKREFHFVSGSSSKFWSIEAKGSSFEVVYGKIGTPGTKQAKSFADAAGMQVAYDKLIVEKTSKGYVEVGGSGGTAKAGKAKNAKGRSASEPLSELYFGTTRNTSDMENITSFIGKRVIRFKNAKSAKSGGNVYSLRVGWDDEETGSAPDRFQGLLNEFLEGDAAPDAKGLIIGTWSVDGPSSCKPIVETLVKNSHRMPDLQAIFHGDISQEENEISWIEQCDVSDLINLFPKLELFRVRGGQNLEFKKVKSSSLRALGVETGGLDRKVVGQIIKADLPNLEFLELWLGTENYGGSCRASDLQPLLNGKLFPKLKYLGLRNSEIADELAGVLVNAPITKQLETLDLSLGTMSDEGARALLKLPTKGKLKRLNLHRNFLTPTVIKELKKLPFTLNALDQEAPDDWGDGETRFVAIGE